MKRLSLLLVMGLLSLAIIGMSCGGPKDPIEPEQPVVVDTTPAVEPVIEEEPPPPPAPKLKEEQFQTVYFDFDKYSLRSDAKTSLDANYGMLVEFPDVIVKIEGHCDERGTVEYNMSLGEKRAKSVQDYLVGLGIAADRVSTISYGKERPIDNSSNEASWAKNRRGEFRIISQ